MTATDRNASARRPGAPARATRLISLARAGAAALLAVLAGLALGACGGSLYDAATVPEVPGGNQCIPASQHLCAGSNLCWDNDDPTHCGDACVTCTAAPANGAPACVQGAGGAWGCGFACNAPTRACGAQCLLDDVNACGPTCQVCASPANGTATCTAGAGGIKACGFTCAPGFLALGGTCQRPTAVAAGATHACAITEGGGLRCWGSNAFGQLGAVGPGGPAPVTVFTSGVTLVATGGLHTCAVHAGQLKCWGDNQLGQLGSGAVGAGGPTPVAVGLAGVTQLAAGARHTCAVVTSGAPAVSRVSCWGSNAKGQLGTGDRVAHPAPVGSLVTSGAVQVAAAESNTCALVEGAGALALECWGANESGQTGKGQVSADERTPVPVPLPAAPEQVSVGGSHACAIVAGLGLYCWGSDLEWQLGTSNPPSAGLVPAPADKVDNGARAGVVATGGGHTCAGRADPAEVGMSCSGRNDAGQVGTTAGPGNPANDGNVALAGHAVVATSGSNFTCALVDQGAGAMVVQCWGDNSSGQLGRSTAGSFDATPGLVGP